MFPRWCPRNPFDKFQLGLRQMIEDIMIQRMSDNDRIVTRYMDDKEFGDAAFGVLSKSIYESIPSGAEVREEAKTE
jgi:type I restriction enzyme R subunit